MDCYDLYIFVVSFSGCMQIGLGLTGKQFCNPLVIITFDMFQFLLPFIKHS